jgi:type I restriction enzyme S subunit
LGTGRSPTVCSSSFTDAWEQRKLGELCSLITKGTTPIDKSDKGTINFVKIENIDSISGEIKPEMKVSISEHNGDLKRSQLQENDILFSIAGTLGRVATVNIDILPANTNQALAIIRLREGNLNYISIFLKGKAVKDFIKRNPTIGAQPNLSLTQVADLFIQFPSLSEQQRIGAFFRTLDSAITLHQRE